MDQKIAERYCNYTFFEDPYIMNIRGYVDLERTEIVHRKGRWHGRRAEDSRGGKIYK